MRQLRHKYILLSSFALLLAGACTDDLLYEDGVTPTDPNAVKYSAEVGRAFDVMTRGGEESLYEPLVATAADGPEKLYLHTYETDVIGEKPGDDEQKTRGYQVSSVAELVKYHKDFYVHAQYADNGQEYIEWLQAKAETAGSNIWLTNKTEYWPADRELAFHAVAPSSEFSALQQRSNSTNNSLSFTYSAKKGTANNDAQAQKDLLIATSTCNKEKSVGGKAPLQFHHALSSVKFAIRDVMGGEVVNIKIKGVYGTGACYYTADADGSNGAFSWSDHQNKQTYSQNFNYKVPDRIVGDLTSDAEDLKMYQDLPEYTFMLIPQAIPDDAEVIITIKFDSTSDMEGYEKEVKAYIKANNVTEWKPGHEYVYTISTSNDNWVYVFTATGNHIAPKGASIPNFNKGTHANVKDPNDYTAQTDNHGDNENCNIVGDMIYVFSPSRNRHDDYGDDAYFRVKSYRYRANNHSHIENLPWEATYDLKGEQWREIKDNEFEYVSNRDLEANMSTTWITDKNTNKNEFKGDGDHSEFGKLYNITFAAHHQMTDWKGDQWMDDNDFYASAPNNSETSPWDLSTFGGQIKESSANCYIIDRPGWYSFPCYYGNSRTLGKALTNSYTYSSGLKTFESYNGTISGYKIPFDQCVSADVLWSDVYNVVTPGTVKVVDNGNNSKKIVFQANKGNMQQGNFIIALYDKNGTVVWSWHIWVTEHWLDPNTGISDAFTNYQSDTGWNYTAAIGGSGWRERGDVKIEVDGFSKWMSAYNIGWCDPKNVDYLRRPATMTFKQKRPDGKLSQVTLPIIQDGERVEYKFGNNTYYQFGRKDPMVGFVDHNSEVKRNFGPKQYDDNAAQYATIKQSIKNPEKLYCRGDYNKNNWLNTNYLNMWNNSANIDEINASKISNVTVVKTVYDPSPAGYVVPPANILRFIGPNDNGKYNDSGSSYDLKKFNGVKLDEYTYKVKRNSSVDIKSNNDVLWFTSTGNRWYTDNFKHDDPDYKNEKMKNMKGGQNFNPTIVYLWSCTVQNITPTNGYGIALGNDPFDDNGNYKHCITPYFMGRRSMARPIRAVRITF